MRRIAAPVVNRTTEPVPVPRERAQRRRGQARRARSEARALHRVRMRAQMRADVVGSIFGMFIVVTLMFANCMENASVSP